MQPHIYTTHAPNDANESLTMYCLLNFRAVNLCLEDSKLTWESSFLMFLRVGDVCVIL